MKQRTPVYITILIIVCLLFIVLYMFVQNTSFLASPYFWGTAVISIILTFIHHSIGQLIENENFIRKYFFFGKIKLYIFLK